MPEFDFSLIDTADKSCVKFAAGEKGVAYICLRGHGLFKFVYSESEDLINITKLSADTDTFYRMGLGLNRPRGNYFEPGKALYVAARIDGVYGFFRSLDEGR